MIFDNLELEQFLVDGYVVLRGAFPRAVALECREFVWQEVLRWDHCTTYGQPMVQIQTGFGCAPFDRIMNDRLTAALDELVGRRRWKAHNSWGWWSLLFPGFQGPGGWHVDEFKTSTYRLVSPLKAVQTIFLFSDVGPGDGATPIVRGSHRDVARMLAAAEPKGIEPGPEFQRRLEAMADSSRIVSFTGEAGDVAMMHPFLVHGFGANTGTGIRFACNPLFELIEPLRLELGDAGYSAVEQAIRMAISLDR
jgi:hypothetical protein